MRSEFIVCLGILIITNGVFGDETDEMKTEEVKKVEGESVTLHSGVEEYHQITWMLGPQDRNIAHCRGNTDGTRSCAIVDERLRDRLKINQTGSLTIINISTELAGLYKLQIIDNSSKQSSHKEFNVTVSEAGLEPDHTKLKLGLGLGLGLGLLLVLVGVMIYCCRNPG